MITTGSIIGLLIELVLAMIVIYAIYLFLGILALPQQVKTIILLLIAVVAIVFLAGLFGIHV